MSPGLWTVTAIAFGLVAGLVTGLGAALSAPIPLARGAGISAGLSAGLLASTLVVILWYSWETRRLVDAQRESNELDQHPWLSATSLKIETIEPAAGKYAFGGHGVWLPIENVGRAPAFDVVVAVEVSVQGSDPADNAKPLRKDVANQVIVPHDTLHIRFPEILWSGIPFQALAKVSIHYRVIDGGRGKIDLEFRCQEGIWLNGPTRYKFWKRDGTTYRPAPDRSKGADDH